MVDLTKSITYYNDLRQIYRFFLILLYYEVMKTTK